MRIWLRTEQEDKTYEEKDFSSNACRGNGIINDRMLRQRGQQ